MNPTLIKNYVADGAVPGRTIVVAGSADGRISAASGAAVPLKGISERLDAPDGRRFDVVRAGLAEVTYGGAVADGDPLTADAQGRAVKAEPAPGANVWIIGFAERDGVLGDIGLAMIAPGSIQG